MALNAHTPFQLATQRLIIRLYEPADRMQFEDRILEAVTPETLVMVENMVSNFNDKIGQAVSIRQRFTLAGFDMQHSERLVLDMTFSPTRDSGAMSIAYYTREKYRQKQLMTEALRTVLPHLMAAYSVREIQASIVSQNRASLRTAGRLGFMPDANMRGRFVYAEPRV